MCTGTHCTHVFAMIAIVRSVDSGHMVLEYFHGHSGLYGRDALFCSGNCRYISVMVWLCDSEGVLVW